MNDVTVISVHETEIDSISFSLYETRKSGQIIFSLERFLKNEDVKKYRIIDTLNLKTPNITIKVDDSYDMSTLILIENKKSIKKWSFKKNRPIKSTVDSLQSKRIVKTIIGDINTDGINDKIEVYENINGNDEFEKNHFKLPLRIYKGLNKGFMVWRENNNILYNQQNNCVSEGFSNIVMKDSYFTIEGQTCYDYNILVNTYITFIAKDNEIWLYKYGEEYFDKVNHDRQIPTKIWTSKDFGKVKFEDVTEEMLLKLRN